MNTFEKIKLIKSEKDIVRVKLLRGLVQYERLGEMSVALLFGKDFYVRIGEHSAVTVFGTIVYLRIYGEVTLFGLITFGGDNG